MIKKTKQSVPLGEYSLPHLKIFPKMQTVGRTSFIYFKQAASREKRSLGPFTLEYDMKKILIFGFLIFNALKSYAGTNEIVQNALSNTKSYLIVDLARRNPNESADFWRRFPEVIPQEIPAGYFAAGFFLFKKERISQGTRPIPNTAIMDLIKIYQPREWPVCRCMPYYVMAVVLLNSKGNVEAVMMFDVNHDSFSFDDVKGNSFRFRFGSSDTHTKELIKAFDSEKNYGCSKQPNERTG